VQIIKTVDQIQFLQFLSRDAVAIRPFISQVISRAH